MKPKMKMTEAQAIQAGKMRHMSQHKRAACAPRTPLQALGSLRVLGLAMDEALLATAMVGSVGVFGAVTIPWDDIFVGASHHVQTQLEQIEEANTRFYHHLGRWPYEMTNGTPANNVAALVSKQALRFPYNMTLKYRPQLDGIPYDVRKDGITLRHNFGQGGAILQRKSTHPGFRAEITMEGVPFSILQDLDHQIDGNMDLNSGRVRQRIAVNGRIDLVYYANPTAFVSR